MLCAMTTAINRSTKTPDGDPPPFCPPICQQ
jgi:hypothetical protein